MVISMDANTIVFSVWFLIGAALVFWMQAGFAMVEAGFTRLKNTGNIIMKNLMDFCIGTVVFIADRLRLMFLGEDLVGLIGRPGFDIFTAYAKLSTGRPSCSTWCSAPPRRPSSPARWRSAPSFSPTVFTPA